MADTFIKQQIIKLTFSFVTVYNLRQHFLQFGR